MSAISNQALITTAFFGEQKGECYSHLRGEEKKSFDLELGPFTLSKLNQHTTTTNFKRNYCRQGSEH